MLGKTHSLLVQLLANTPDALLLLVPGAADGGVREGPLRRLSEDFTQIMPTEYRADLVLTLGDPPLEGFVIEVQTGRDDQKPWTWPVYQATARARLKVPITLVVVTISLSVATWARKPMHLGNNDAVHAVVVGPDELVALLPEHVVAGRPEMAVLSMLAHDALARKPPISLGIAALRTIAYFDGPLAEDDRLLYLDIVTEMVPAAVHLLLEEEMNLENWEPKTDFVKDLVARRKAAREEGLAEGREEGLAEGREHGELAGQRQALMLVLQSRGLGVTDAQVARIDACEDKNLLGRWISEATTARDARGIAPG